MLTRAADPAKRATLLLLMGFVLVHVGAGEAVAQITKSKKPAETATAAKLSAKANSLPAAVVEMREGILDAVRSGRIEDLQVPIAWNELPPSFATAKVEHPIAYWKRLSADGEGREILAVLADLFEAGHAVVPSGRDVENNRLFVWPRFAEQALDTLSPEDEVQLYRLITPAEFRAMREKKKWTGWRLTIGADGTWHSFLKQD